MKLWPVVLLILFAVVAGYKFSGYQQQLSQSKAEKERLSFVLERSRATGAGDLKVIKAAPKLSSNTQNNDASDNALSNAELTAQQAVLHYFKLQPNLDQLHVGSVNCSDHVCQVAGNFSGSEVELDSLIYAIENETWWQYSLPEFTRTPAINGIELTVDFSLLPVFNDHNDAELSLSKNSPDESFVSPIAEFVKPRAAD